MHEARASCTASTLHVTLPQASPSLVQHFKAKTEHADKQLLELSMLDKCFTGSL